MYQPNHLPRLRTIPQAMEEIRRSDPNTALTLRALRRMVNNQELPSVQIASKRLIDVDLLFNRLSCYNTDVFCVSHPEGSVTDGKYYQTIQ